MDVAAAEVIQVEAIPGAVVVIPAGAVDTRGEADNSSRKMVSPDQREGPLPRMILPSSTRCWTSFR